MTNGCDFTFYRDAYGGSLSQQEFTHFLGRAAAFLYFATRGKSDKEPQRDTVKLALCAVADSLAQAQKTDGIRSERAGQYAVTYQEGAKNPDSYQAAAVYLEDGMLFRGWGGC